LFRVNSSGVEFIYLFILFIFVVVVVNSAPSLYTWSLGLQFCAVIVVACDRRVSNHRHVTQPCTTCIHRTAQASVLNLIRVPTRSPIKHLCVLGSGRSVTQNPHALGSFQISPTPAACYPHTTRSAEHIVSLFLVFPLPESHNTFAYIHRSKSVSASSRGLWGVLSTFHIIISSVFRLLASCKPH
jgi:hypothetical protein